jgi:arabinofuranan 3-O-arabinosyltransferase
VETRTGPAAERATGPPGGRTRWFRRAWRWTQRASQLPPPVDRTPTRYLFGGLLLLLTAALLQRPGAIVADTKVALALDPAHFLGRVLHLWDPTSDSGMISNQSTGYLMPMGPFFLLTHALGIPTAVAQRFWLTFVLGAAFWGAVRLADALGAGNRLGRLLGGLAYALSPVMLSRIGDNSGLVIGGAFLPWMLLPLVRATWTSHLPPEQRTFSARRAAALSGCAVLLAGGINATVTLDVLIAPALWLILMCRGRRAWVLRGWWVVAVIFATSWWLVALRMQGAYGIDFPRYTESSAATTSVTSLPETLRGTADWLAYLRVSGLGVPAAWLYISTPLVVGGSFALVAFGLLGLGRRAVPARRFLLASLLIGVASISAAYAGDPHGVLATQWRDALGGSLSAFRNVTKFQPLIRLPLAIGLAHCLPVLAAKRPGAKRLRRAARHVTRVAVPLALATAVVIGSAPLLVSRTYPNGSFTSVPAYWKQAANWLNASATDSRTLLLPATPTGNYSWGTPSDEPMLWLAHTDWAVRNLIPLGGVNSTRLLDAIEKQLQQRSAPDLDEVLARSGVGYVLVRNDLPMTSPDVPPSTYQLHAALYASGLRRVASFGPLTAPRPSALQRLTDRQPDQTRFPALEIYAGSARRVDSYPLRDLAVLSGGSEAIPTLAATGMLGDRPLITASDLADPGVSHTTLPAGARPSTWIDTDTLQRRNEQYGTIHGDPSYLLTPGSNAAGATGDPQRRLDVAADGHETVASYSGIRNVTASGYGFILAGVPQLGPQNAVDGDQGTAWVVAGFADRNVGQWWQAEFPQRREVASLQLSLLAESTQRSRITKIRVTTQSGTADTTLKNTESLQDVSVPTGATSWLRLTILGVSPGTDQLFGPGLREVVIPGTFITKVAELPDDAAHYFPAGGPTTQTFVIARDRNDPLSALDTDPEKEVAREFVVQRTGNFAVRGTAVASAGFVLPTGATAKGTLDLACGTGPTIVIDGTSYQTSLHGSPYSFISGQPVDMWLCDLRPVQLAAGRHTIRSVAGYLPLRVATLTVTTAETSNSEKSSPAVRQGTIGRWGSEHRSISLPAGPAVVLTVHENFNTSWKASLNGQPLQAIRVDGWQQGFVVPAGPAGTVTLTNAPGIALQKQLVIAFVLVLLLLLGAALPARRTRPTPRLAGQPSRWLSLAAGLVAVAVTMLLTAGPLAAAVVPGVALLVWLLRRAAPLLVVGALAAAATLEIVEPHHFVSSGKGAFSPAAQLCVAAAVAIVVLLGIPVLRPRPRAETSAALSSESASTGQPHEQGAPAVQDV